MVDISGSGNTKVDGSVMAAESSCEDISYILSESCDILPLESLSDSKSQLINIYSKAGQEVLSSVLATTHDECSTG